MARYIDADEFLNAIYNDKPKDPAFYIAYYIATCSTADVVDRKKGEWIACEHDKWMHGVYALRCSNCNGGYHLSTEQTIGTWNFCPNCGADMRGEKDERVN